MLYSLEKENLQTGIPYLARILFRLKKEIKSFIDKKRKMIRVQHY